MAVAAANRSQDWSVSKLNRAVLDVEIKARRSSDWEQWVLLTSDRHHDNPKSLRGLEYEHLRECQDRGGLCVDVGDFFCAMQGKYDKRADKSDIRDEHQGSNYLDRLVSTAVDDFEEFADVLVAVGRGNHETAITKRHETDLTERFCYGLSERSGFQVHAMGYTGWVRFKFNDNGFRSMLLLWFTHGYGGGGPVTKGVIQSNRKQVYLPDADIIFSGHIHERWTLEIPRVRITKRGEVRHDYATHVCNPTYKEEYGDGQGGWHIERGGPPKPIGATWLRFYWSRRHRSILFDVTAAR